MAYLTPDQMQDGNSEQKTVKPGTSANVVLTDYAPFNYGPNKDKVMPKHLGTDAETGEKYEFVGFAFHDAVKQLNDDIVPGTTVVNVKCLDTGTKYPDYELTIVKGTEKKADAPF